MLTVFFYINFVIVIINATSTVDSKPAGDSLLWTPRHADRSQSPETHKEMTEINSCYYGPSLLRKCGNFHTAPPPPPLPEDFFSLFFLSLKRTLKYFVQYPLFHISREKQFVVLSYPAIMDLCYYGH